MPGQYTKSARPLWPRQLSPLHVDVAGGRRWKLSTEINYFVETLDPSRPEWSLAFNVSPIVKNRLAEWFGL